MATMHDLKELIIDAVGSLAEIKGSAYSLIERFLNERSHEFSETDMWKAVKEMVAEGQLIPQVRTSLKNKSHYGRARPIC